MAGIYDSDNDFKPGTISQTLREALNLGDNELPVWIYRMRALGYPPGWLKKAVVEELNIFVTDNENDSKKQNAEEGEIQETRYDHERFISYPGFNAPLPQGCVDYHYFYNMPYMLPHQQLDFAKATTKTPEKPNLKRSRHKPDEKEDEDENDEEDESKDIDEKNKPNEVTSCADQTVVAKNISSSVDNNINDNDLNKDISEETQQGGFKLISLGASSTKKIKKEEEHNEDASKIKLIAARPSDDKLTPSKAPSLDKFSHGSTDLIYFQNIHPATGMFAGLRGFMDKL